MNNIAQLICLMRRIYIRSLSVFQQVKYYKRARTKGAMASPAENRYVFNSDGYGKRRLEDNAANDIVSEA